ncbi:MAG: hypothetical protein PVG99_14095 [Desulfobacteraceae bacterium]|jgi:hypothetical protein
MAKKFKGFSFKEHQSIGKEIHRVRQQLRALDERVLNAYGKSSKAAKLTEKSLKEIALLQSELNERVCEENPTSSNLELLACYYPKQE